MFVSSIELVHENSTKIFKITTAKIIENYLTIILILVLKEEERTFSSVIIFKEL